MAVTAYTGPPGAGKTYALVSEVVVPGVAAGRRVLTNIEGIEPQKILDYCAAKNPDADLGEVVTFHGDDAKGDKFFPTESLPDSETFVKGGDLLVFDEFRLTFQNRGKVGSETLEPFLRWHRHLVGPDGRATDVVIGSQLIADIHRDFRGVLAGSYKFKKLSAVGLPKAYQYRAFEGDTQPKGGGYRTGNGKYKKEIFELYSSYSAGADANEAKTDSRGTLFSKGFLGMGGVALLLLIVGSWRAYAFFNQSAPDVAPQVAYPTGVPAAAAPVSDVSQASQRYRIVGMISGDGAPLVVISDDQGETRLESARNFEFRGDRPIAGMVDGQRVIARDRVEVQQEGVEF